ncbi:MAG: PilZ domain-containing protein [Planctomycetota bacterium]
MAKTIKPFESPEKFAERRSHPRAKAEFDITIGAAEARTSVRVRDISKSGVAFVSPQPIPEMTLVRMELVLPHTSANAQKTNNTIKADGAVVRCEKRDVVHGDAAGYDVGVFFMAITDTSREEIDEFVKMRLQTAE